MLFEQTFDGYAEHLVCHPLFALARRRRATEFDQISYMKLGNA